MKSRLIAVLCGAVVVLTGCGGLGTASVEATLRGEGSPARYDKESIDRNTAIAQCGLIGGLLNGDMPIYAENYEEVMDTLQSLADDGVGAVKPTAEHILAQIDGEEFSNGEDTAVIEEFKDFCMDYTVG